MSLVVLHFLNGNWFCPPGVGRGLPLTPGECSSHGPQWGGMHFCWPIIHPLLNLPERAFLLLLVVSAFSYTCLPLPVPWGLLILGCHTVLLGACMAGPVEQAERGRTSVGRQGWVDQSMWQSREAPGEQTKGPEGMLAAGCLPRCPCRVFLLPPRAGVSTLPPPSAFEARRKADHSFLLEMLGLGDSSFLFTYFKTYGKTHITSNSPFYLL